MGQELPAGFDARRAVASDLFIYLGGLALLVAIVSPWAFVRPLMVGSVALLFAAGSVLARWVSERGRPEAAMHGLVVLTTLALLPMLALAAQVSTPTLVLLMTLPAYAAVCGWGYALWAGALYVASAVLVTHLRSQGVDWPILFPTLPKAQITLSAVVIVGVVMPLPLVFSRLDAALERAREELTRRRQVELALDQARTDREAILDALPDYMFKLGEDGRIEDFCSALVSDLPLMDGGLRGRLVSDVFLPDTWQVVREALAEAAEHGISRGRITRSPMRTGLRWFELSVVPMEGAEGERKHFIMLARDITERRQQESERRLQALVLDQIQDHVTVARLDGEVRHVNQAVQSHHGLPAEALRGHRLQDFSLACDLAPDGAGILETTLRDGAWRGRVLSRDQHGLDKVLDMRTTLVKNEVSRPVAIVAVGTDVTQQERAMQALAEHQQQLERVVAERTAEATEARRQAEASNRAKSVFLATMSHEMRTPLNAVLGHAQFLLQQDLGPARNRHLQPLVAASQHLLALVNNTLDFSKIEAGELNLLTEDFSLRTLLASSLELVRDQALNRGLALHLEVADELPDALHGDALRIKQCLLNYLGNALKFTDRGEVTLRVRAEPAASPAGEGELGLHFEVQDTGIGIEPDLQPLLFQPFHQLDSSPTRRHGGTGLGLTVTRRLAQAMGGDVGVHSQAGAGSCFWFSVQLRRALAPLGTRPVATEGDAPAALRREFPGLRVLLVEDDPVNRDLFQAMLADIGVVLDMAGNGQEAVDALSQRTFDLVLMDLQMPVMGGLEATVAIRALPGLAQLPILGLSANAFDSDRAACGQAGMNGFIGKPVQFDEFYAQLLKALRARRPASLLAPGPGLDLPAAAPASTANPVARYPGLDVAAGLKTWRSPQAFARFLQVFVGHYAGVADQMRGAPPAQVLALAHKLKGAAGALGLAELAAAAAQLERCLRNGTEATEAQTELEAALAVALRAIEHYAADVSLP